MTEGSGAIARDQLNDVVWHISTRSSGASGNCVEAGALRDGSGRVAVRHSRHRDDATFVYTRTEWDAFIATAKSGDFDFAA